MNDTHGHENGDRYLRDKTVVSMPDGAEVTIRYSLGAAFFPAEETDRHELFRIADERMYADKRQRKELTVQ